MKNNICAIAPNAFICPDGDDTTLEGNRNRALDILIDNKFEFAAFLDDDTFVDSDWIDEMLKAAEIYPKIAAFASVVRTDSTKLIQGCGHILQEAAPHDARIDQKPICPCGNSAFIRREAIDRIRKYDSQIWDPRFNQWQTCFDFGLKLVLTGSKTMLVPKATAQHRGYMTWNSTIKKQKKGVAPIGQLSSRFLLYRKFLPANLLIEVEELLTIKINKWVKNGYPGFEGWLSGNHIYSVIDRAKEKAERLWRQRPDTTWLELMAHRRDARNIWGF